MSKVRWVAVVAAGCMGLAGWRGGSLNEAQGAQLAATRPARGESMQPTAKTAAQPGPASRPAGQNRRVLLHEDFEGAKGNWGGKVITDNVPAGGKHALLATPTETHWARRASVGNGEELMATADMVLTFFYQTSKDIPITIYIFDPTQKDNLRYDIKKPVVGKWTQVTVNINRDFRRNDGSSGKVQPGDALRGVSFLSGRTGHDEFELAVADVEITGQE